MRNTREIPLPFRYIEGNHDLQQLYYYQADKIKRSSCYYNVYLLYFNTMRIIGRPYIFSIDYED